MNADSTACGVVNGGSSKLPFLRYPVKRRMALERPYVVREEAKANGAAPKAVVDAIEAASRRHPQHGQTDQNMMATEMVDTGEEET